VRLPALLVLGLVLALGGCGEEDVRQEAQQPQLPRALAATCATLARDDVPVLCPPPAARDPSGPADRRLAVIHEDLDPDPCAYVVNVQQPDHDLAGERPAHVVLGGSCARLPLGRPGTRWAIDPLASLRAVATPPLQSGQTPDQVTLRRPLVLRRLTVRGQAGTLLQFDARPPGGLHGGHYGLAWNEDGHGYLLSVHWATPPERRAPRADEVAALTRFAASLRPTPG
jgi:hypothetical protein